MSARRRPIDAPHTRRAFLRYGGSLGLAAAGLPGGSLWRTAAAAGSIVHRPDSLPDPRVPAGTVNEAMPFDHIIVIMMENHSFDNALGALAHSGQPNARGLRFSPAGIALNSNPGPSGRVRSFALPTAAQPPACSQSWNATHAQIDGGKMDGFVRSVENDAPMGYWTPEVLPFIYSMARTFCVNNRWFSSAPCQTYPNRRFLMAGTAYGNISTSSESLKDPPPPNGTIWDRLHAYGISWTNYFTDLPSTIEKYPSNIASIAQFYADCAAGSLPSVSLVDPEFGVVSEVGSALSTVPALAPIAEKLTDTGGDEEGPQDMSYGEYWAYQTVKAILESPAWPRTLLIYTYDEHGGYYDHMRVPLAIEPDSIQPQLGPGDVPGAYNIYGPRVPAIVASPYSKPNAVTNVLHDHTSFLATVEAKWNLPRLTYRDANARTVMDFLDPQTAAFMNPPTIAEPPAPVEAVAA